MTVSLCEVGRRGRLDLTFTNRRGRTCIADAYSETPFKITRLHDTHSSGIAHLILMHTTAGLFGGDVLDCTIHLQTGARVVITQQSAMKIHPSRGLRAIQNCRIRIEEGAELRLYNHPLIPFAESRLTQTTSIDMDKGSRLCFWESVMAGRVGSGEAWLFDELSSETRLRTNSTTVYLERFRIAPKEDPPIAFWKMRNARFLATGLCFDDQATEVSERLHTLMPEAGVDTPNDGLTVIRVAVADGIDFHRFSAAFRSFTSSTVNAGGAVHDR